MVRILIVAAVATGVFVLLLFLPIEVPYTLSVPGKVLPAREWALIRGQDGALQAVLRDYAEGTVQTYAANRFERGDAVRYTLHSALQPAARVEVGDTVGTIYSYEVQRELARLRGQLATATASLAFYTAGEKEALIEEAQLGLARAEQQAQEHRKVLERLQSLHERHVISDLEFEIAESRQQIYETDIAIARAQLEARRTGEKQEQVNLARSEAATLRGEIETLSDRLSLLTITAPIAGTVSRAFEGDTLLTVRDTAFVVVMPIRWRDHQTLVPGQPVQVHVSDDEAPVGGVLHQIGDTVHLLNGEQVLLATATLDVPAPALLPGLMAPCSISYGSLSLRAYLLREVQSVFS